ncbi:ADP-L-glycero-D-manno-heptose-6-epimerase [Hymenobacter qilianensis]|uniref:ADP-L-glycero-D-manno-heptose-6-epimerase n=2 Tax=Hymenobacter qilianensis TaxID=1385715 RepID=A0ACB5PKS2_9BACT|nr:ADP-glyceromanno-heptose 6-epimerase [Hymenobacter qilianensis]QNP51010.1 ADP-glyceromanno-heptose 6-epimerase [Hymenobacter qilianensis]GGF48617.1 ADP-L-glycero-D-manno-heptose-6-epimerase [Hymenobacter qilianensis]
MIVVTGAAGFIASCLVTRLNAANFNDIVVVDNFTVERKLANLKGKRLREYVDRNDFFEWLDKNHEQVEFIFHLGARTDTTEKSREILDLLNLEYSKKVWHACCQYQLPLVYASSAATYGSGTLGYADEDALLPLLRPLNPYGESKNDFDNWAVAQEEKPFFWAGLKFFNVYGPNEYHKGRMASVIFHAYEQIRRTGSMELFRSHNPEYADGEQKRDFVYVKDVCEVCYFLMHHRKNSGIYNLGSGEARTFLDLALNTFAALNQTADIRFKDTPEDIRDTYQYFTQAEMQKLRSIGYDRPFTRLEDGIQDYVQNYLVSGAYL